MPDEQRYILWEDASDAQRAAVIDFWWRRVNPTPGSDEYLMLQMMSGSEMGHGDPESARQELFNRGLLELIPGDRASFTEKGCEVFSNLYDMVYREYDMSTAEPTAEGVKRHPPDGYFRTDFFGEPVSEPCTCTADCPEWCEGDCGCEACFARLVAYAAPGSACGEQ